MLLTLFAAAILQAPPQASQPTAEPATATAAQPARNNRRRQSTDGLVCEQRAPTGSVMRRNMCRSQRRAEADAQVAQQYVSEVTRGVAHQPMELGGGLPTTP